MNSVSTVGMDRADWLAQRRDTIGSSDIGAILQLNNYETPRELFNKKVGLAPEFEGNDNTEWGTELEDFCALMFQRKNPDFFPKGGVEEAGKYGVQRDNKIRRHAAFPWATCNLDRLIVGDGNPIILELKTTTSYAVGAWDAAVPTSYYAQLQWQMFVTGYRRAIIWVAVLDKKKFIRLDVDWSEEFEKVMVDAAVKFHNAVVFGDVTDIPVAARDTESMKPELGSKIEATEEIKEKVASLVSVKSKITELEKIEKELKAELVVFVGEYENLVEGERVLATYSIQHKAAFAVTAKDIRVFSLKREKGAKLP
jgi:putative phage-type endonuclease